MASNPQDWRELITSRKPVRVLVIVYPGSSLFKESNLSLIRDTALQRIGADEKDCKTLILSTWTRRTALVLDLCHTTYDFKTAHHPESLTVIIVHIISETKITVNIARAADRDETNKQVAHMHESQGFDAILPMVEEHRNGAVPSYPNPRSLMFRKSERALKGQGALSQGAGST
ncbi:hypothetical protein L228DRAFT_284140 [Xylona heveae TC161]|uniref:Uncharacterized protein n=1 Tax=Xylona heveae (strain CBS 132557 / TC161) TaxID=1328760 RepID=A0A165FK21_XYLHT|nr:hypothetical protein L228DRAFT_284140 [Xylona heveae TC161]KZF21068.1 hypothetical protein L228DRAFT_284140 [Xylona heveae TC161]